MNPMEPVEAGSRELQEAAGKAAAMLRAVGNERRLMVLCLLIEQGEMPVGRLAERVGLSPSALSRHLARMRDEGLVAFRRKGWRPPRCGRPNGR